MNHGIKTIIVPVKDLAAAKALYTALLGVETYADAPYYVGFRVGEQEIGLDPNGLSNGQTGPIGYSHVDDIEASLKALLDAGRPAGAGGQRRRRRKADRIRARHRWQRHRAAAGSSMMTATARSARREGSTSVGADSGGVTMSTGADH